MIASRPGPWLLDTSVVADLLIAAVAHANGLPLATRNAGDLDGLDDLAEVPGV